MLFVITEYSFFKILSQFLLVLVFMSNWKIYFEWQLNIAFSELFDWLLIDKLLLLVNNMRELFKQVFQQVLLRED